MSSMSSSKTSRLLKTIQLPIFCFDPCIEFVTFQRVEEVLFILISRVIQKFISEPLQVRFPPSTTQSKTQHLWTIIQLKIIVVLPCIRILLSLNFGKRFTFSFSRHSNSYFTKTTSFLFSIRVDM